VRQSGVCNIAGARQSLVNSRYRSRGAGFKRRPVSARAGCGSVKRLSLVSNKEGKPVRPLSPQAAGTGRKRGTGEIPLEPIERGGRTARGHGAHTGAVAGSFQLQWS
jgi:hypothetical protein